MPTRPSRSSSAPSHDHKRAIAYHAAAITMLWVVVLLMSLGVWLVLLADMIRLDRLDAEVTMIAQDFVAAQQTMQAQPTVPTQAPMIPATPPQPMPSPTSTLPPTTGSASLPGMPGNTTSPDGLLDRGSLSPDGTKFAGFDDTTAGKIGIAVEVIASQQEKHIVIFNPSSESTGKGMPQEGDLSVRWVDNSHIQYDELIKQDGQWFKQTKTVEIFF
ncbi:MAG: hypothetical protein WA001_00625 [Patescibacteria group bacterium]